jgi:SAM-dependent methyltransferase
MSRFTPDFIPARFNKTLLVAKSLGGLLPGINLAEFSQMKDILKVASGSSGWMLEMARTHPHIQVTGLETNVDHIDYASTLAQEQNLTNVSCRKVAQFSDPFDFPAASFDLVSSQFVSYYLTPEMWPPFLAECWRVLRPGGIMYLTELEVGMANSPAYEELVSLYIRAQQRAHRSFGTTGRHLGLLCELEPLMQGAGFETSLRAYAINFSYGIHPEWSIDLLIQSRLAQQPLIVEMGVATQEKIDALHRQQQMELHHPTFHGLLPLLTILGKKPPLPDSSDYLKGFHVSK